MRSHADWGPPRYIGQRWNPNARERPGAMWRARSACSIASVPEPAIGSTNGASGSTPPSARTAAASVSFIGASVLTAR